jgi:hypothetical protein
MKKIENRKELNAYFKQVNTEIDKYINEHKIRPSRLSKYIKSNGGVSKFVKDLGLSDISGIDKVVDQALKSRLHMEKDGILKFESFRMLENAQMFMDSQKPEKNETNLLTLDVIYDDMKPSNIEHEKVLADYFDRSLGHVEESDVNTHKYIVDNKYEAYIFLADDVVEIQKNIDDLIIANVSRNIGVKLTDSQSANVKLLNHEFYYDDLDYNLERVLRDLFKISRSGYDETDNYIIIYKTL